MMLTETEIKFKKLGCVLGIVQGLTWEILAFICIILYIMQSDPVLEPSSYMESIGNAMYVLFIVNSEKAFDGQVFTKHVFFVFMLFHLSLNVVWTILSAYLLKKTTSKSVLLWSYITLAVALLDFITFAMLGSDYDKCLDWAKDYGTEDMNQIVISLEGSCANIILPVFVIAAKGFTLWVMNIALGVTMWKAGNRIK